MDGLDDDATSRRHFTSRDTSSISLDGYIDEWMDGWMDGWIDGWMDR